MAAGERTREAAQRCFADIEGPRRRLADAEHGSQRNPDADTGLEIEERMTGMPRDGFENGDLSAHV